MNGEILERLIRDIYGPGGLKDRLGELERMPFMTPGKMNNIEDRIDAIDDRLDEVDTRTETVVARYSTSAAQVITTGSASRINFDTKDFDTHDAVSTGSNWRFTAPLSGYYLISAIVTFAGSTAWAVNERVQMRLIKNGAWISTMALGTGLDSSGSATLKSVNGSDVVFLSAGDTLGVNVYQESGSDLALISDSRLNYVTIARL